MGAYRPKRQDAVLLIKETADIVDIIGEHVRLKRAGVNLKGLCPFHSEKTPSFTVSPERRTFHCFGCGEGGDVFTFLMQYHRLTFPEALKELAKRYNIMLPEEPLSSQDIGKAKQREELHAANEKAATLYHAFLLDKAAAAPARRYLAERGIPEETIKRFRLGFAPDRWDFLVKALAGEKFPLGRANEAGLIVPKEQGGYYDRFRNRVLFPLLDLTGRVAGFGGRILGDGQPKYLNSPESLIFDKSKILFGLYQNRDSIRRERQCLVVEGNFDLLSLVVHGVDNVAAPLGTALSVSHVRSLRGYADEAILLFDGDSAGLKAALRAVPLFLSEQLAARVAVLPDGHDPDTFIREQGRKGLKNLISGSRSLPEFVFEALVDRYGLTVEGKSKIVAELRPIIRALGDKNLERTIFANHFGKKLDLPPAQLIEPPSPARLRPAAASQKKEDRLTKNEERLLEFLLVHPEYVAPFFEAGLEAIIETRPGRSVMDSFKELTAGEAGGGPENLLGLVDNQIKPLISRMLIAAPSYAEEVKEETAKEMIAWLKHHALKAKKERLIQQINEAHSARDEALWMELMERKKQMDEAFGV